MSLHFAVPSCTDFPLVFNVNTAAHCAADAKCTKTNINGNFKINSAQFGSTTYEEMNSLLQGRNVANTNKATRSALKSLNDYIDAKGLPKLKDTPNIDLPSLLEKFYADARTKSNEVYHTQSLKNIRSCLNRWFTEHYKLYHSMKGDKLIFTSRGFN